MSKIMYLITGDLPISRQLKILKRLMPLGIDYLQYRNKSADQKTAYNEALQYKVLCDLYGTHLIINDCVELAKAVNASGVHLGEKDESIETALETLGQTRMVGRTAKTVEQAKLAESLGAHYIGVGAFYPSKTKKEALPMTKATLIEIRDAVTLPIFAIGGLTPDNITPDIIDYVDGFAFSNAIWYAERPEEVLKSFKMF
ncbi:MAG: thiamine phosphate synthase, partial [Clostridiales bacterium]|nr:thiamine phosphate synthase [Clostridiales bacterium]